MTTTARRVKKSLKEDQLVTTTFRLTEWAQEHFNQVVIGVVALVAIVAVVVFVANSRESGARQAEREMGAGLTQLQQGDIATARGTFEQIAARHGGAQGAAARFFKAECELRENNYQGALEDYDTYLARSGDYPWFEASALVGKGLAYEGLEKYSEAGDAVAAAVGKLDGKDPRRLDAAIQAGDFYARAGRTQDAAKYYDMVIKEGTGDLKSRAMVAAALLK